MERLSVPRSGIREQQLRKDEAARRLLFRLHELGGGGVPDWHADGSIFGRVEMLQYVDYIDAHLRLAPTLSAMALVAALSPSHFAKKFRRSTGVSLQRFVNRRRILASILPRAIDTESCEPPIKLGILLEHMIRSFLKLNVRPIEQLLNATPQKLLRR